MAAKTKLDLYLEDELKKYKGVRVPIKASVLERLLKKKLPCNKLHPNPDDEFCFEDIGPSYRIISEYEEKYRLAEIYHTPPIEEPIIIEKMLPDGYMILNGHHRWAAAMRKGFKTVPVKIVNLTQETDIKKIIENSKHDKRVIFDLDEVIFRKPEDDDIEIPHGLLFKKFYKERIRKGIPALFHQLSKAGYDIWLYTGDYYSLDYIKHMFFRYHVHVDGIVTGTNRKVKDTPEYQKAVAEIRELFNKTYTETLNIDNESVIRVFNGKSDFDQFEINSKETWAHDVMTAIEKIKREA